MYSTKALSFFAGIFVLAGIVSLMASFAATTVTVDPSLPVPTNVKAYGDDRNIVVRWDPIPGQQNGRNVRVIGYYITYRPKGSTEAYKVRQQQVNRDQYLDYATAIQLQPLQNEVEYEINVQSVSGTFQTKQNGSLVTSGQGSASSFAVADGKVSNKATAYAKASSARVDSMRQRLTGFFDDFNQPAGPFDELKWNTATTACVVPGTASAFINNQFHAHNQIRSLCDRGGIASRPRATFDITSATETNPAVLEFDVDGASQLRDTWYIDLIPLNSRPVTKLPMDITSHNDAADTDHNDPGNNIRINARRDALLVNYYDVNRNPDSLNPFTEDIACDSWNGKNEVSYAACDTTIKTAGLSPLPYPSFGLEPLPNVRRHWVVKITPTKLRIYIDGVFTASVNLPSQFTAQKQYTVHSTVFSYNTAKQYHQVTPYVQLLHWDNFGFTGPAPTEVIHNYLEGGPSGDKPVFSTSNGGGYSIPEGNRTTTIKIPDQIGTLKDGKARLFFTMQDFTAGTWFDYVWKSTDHVIVNGKSYPFPDPRLNMLNPPSSTGDLVQGYIPLAMQIPVNQADIKQGNNEIKFNVNSSVLNVHLELPYVTGSPNIPTYSQPLQIFGDPYREIVEPPFTTCDQYWFVERDLGLAYESGKTNLTTSPCAFMPSHNHDAPSTTPPPTPTPPPANLSPTATVSLSSSSVVAPGSITVNAGASDSDGSIVKLEILQGSTVVATCNNVTTCTYNASNLSQGSYAYSSRAADNAGDGGSSQVLTLTVSSPTPPPSSNRFTTLPVNAVLPSGAECASRVRPVAETRPANTPYNQTRGVGGSYFRPGVDGNYVGTTDEIIQWAACKWGMDEDLLRAQMVQESYWHQSAIGDFASGGATLCSDVYPPGNFPAQYNGDSAHNNQCPESYGLSQVRWTYHKSAFYNAEQEITANLTNNAIYSTAYNVDYYAALWRNCYNGNDGWLNTVERGATYAAGDVQGCQGMWFSGRWRTQPALDYIAAVQNNLNNRVWETTAFRNSQPVNTIPPKDGTTTPPPTPANIAPTASVSVSTTTAQAPVTYTINAGASDSDGSVAKLEILQGSAVLRTCNNATTCSFTATGVVAGSYVYTSRATDNRAAITTSASRTVTVTVPPAPQDTIAPNVSIGAPANNTVAVQGSLRITAQASDDTGVASVQVYVDNTLRATLTNAPYTYLLNTTLLPTGSHIIHVIAKDAANNSKKSQTITFTLTPLLRPGDVDGDNDVDFDDFFIIRKNFNTTSKTRAEGDLNGDTKVDFDDFFLLRANF